MSLNTNIEKIKAQINKSIGQSFDIVAKRGRKKVILENCTLDSVYPSIFVVKHSCKKTGTPSSISFSYTDILTKNVCFFPALSLRSESGEKGA